MKITLLTLFFVFTTSFAFANQYPYTKTLAMMAFQDYHHSVDKIVNGPSIELNPILGPNPSRTDLAMFGLAGTTATFVLEKYMKPCFLRTTILNAIIESERFNIEENDRPKRKFSTIMICFKWDF